MPEVGTTSALTSPETRALDAASAARLRSLTRPGLDPKAFLKSVSALEIGAISLVVLLVVGAVLVYSFWILPDQVRFVQLNGEVSANQKKIDELQAKVVDPNSVTSQYQDVLDSLDQFRGSVLKPPIQGKEEILDQLDRSFKETGVHLSGSVSFNAEQAVVVDPNGRKLTEKKGNDNGVDSYPSLEMHFAVEGTYAQLRAFIARFERGNEFVVIHSVSLGENGGGGGTGGSTDASRAAGGPSVPRARGGDPGALSLDVEMTAYFQPGPEPGAGT